MIRFEGVSRIVQEKRLLDRIEATATRGWLTALIGPNGAGKSTLLNLASGLVGPEEGVVYFDRQPMNQWRPVELARRRACLAQQTTVAFDFSALEVVLFGRHPHHGGRESRQDQQIALAAMEQAGVGHLAHRRCSTLSGGEQQRVHFARCLAQLEGVRLTEACLLLDEPVASLDLAQQHRLLETVRGFCERGLTAIVVVHDLALAARYADELWVMSRGRLVERGPAPEVLNAELLGEVFDVEADVVTDGHGRLHLHVTASRNQREPVGL